MWEKSRLVTIMKGQSFGSIGRTYSQEGEKGKRGSLDWDLGDGANTRDLVRKRHLHLKKGKHPKKFDGERAGWRSLYLGS